MYLADQVTREVVATGSLDNDLHILNKAVGGINPDCKSKEQSFIINRSHSVSLNVINNVWHLRLDHPSYQVMSYMIDSHVNESNSKVCSVCHLAKQERKPFYKTSITSTSVVELLHIDL